MTKTRFLLYVEKFINLYILEVDGSGERDQNLCDGRKDL